MKAYGGVDVYIHIFLTSALAGGKWSVSRPYHSTPGESSWLHRDSNSEPSVVQPVASRYTDYAIPAPLMKNRKRNKTRCAYIEGARVQRPECNLFASSTALKISLSDWCACILEKLCSNLGRVPAIWQDFLWFSSVPPEECQVLSRLGHDRLLQIPFQFIIHQSSYRSTLYGQK
jgi:hypothetical protein